MSGYLPHSGFEIYDPFSSEFSKLQKKLLDLDVKFFNENQIKRHNGFVFTVVLIYDQQHCISRNLDLSHFPQLRTVNESELSTSQQKMAEKLGRRVRLEPPKLIRSNPIIRGAMLSTGTPNIKK
jgi:5-methylthioribose kinase